MADEIIKRTYTVPLRRGFANTPRYRRANKAVTILKDFLKKHMKSDTLKLGPKLNELLWQHGMRNPPGKVKVDVTKDKEGVVRAELSGVTYVDFKVQEKTQKASTFKEKLQSKVADAKSGAKGEEKPEQSAQSAVQTPTVEKMKEKSGDKPKPEAKSEVKPAKTSQEATKVQAPEKEAKPVETPKEDLADALDKTLDANEEKKAE